MIRQAQSIDDEEEEKGLCTYTALFYFQKGEECSWPNDKSDIKRMQYGL